MDDQIDQLGMERIWKPESLSSGEWRKRFEARGIYIPYEMGNQLELRLEVPNLIIGKHPQLFVVSGSSRPFFLTTLLTFDLQPLMIGAIPSGNSGSLLGKLF